MRIHVSLLVLVSFSIPIILDAEGGKKEAPAEKKKLAEKKVELACKRLELSGLVLEVCLPEKNVAGAPIACIVTVTNKSKETITYEYTSTLREFIMEIRDPKGTVVPYTRFGKLVFEGKDVRFIQMKLRPGEDLTLVYDLTRCFDLSMADDYSLSAVSRQTWINEKKISVDALKFSVKDR